MRILRQCWCCYCTYSSVEKSSSLFLSFLRNHVFNLHWSIGRAEQHISSFSTTVNIRSENGPVLRVLCGVLSLWLDVHRSQKTRWYSFTLSPTLTLYQTGYILRHILFIGFLPYLLLFWVYFSKGECNKVSLPFFNAYRVAWYLNDLYKTHCACVHGTHRVNQSSRKLYFIVVVVAVVQRNFGAHVDDMKPHAWRAQHSMHTTLMRPFGQVDSPSVKCKHKRAHFCIVGAFLWELWKSSHVSFIFFYR